MAEKCKCLPEDFRWNAIMALEVAIREKNALVVTLDEKLDESDTKYDQEKLAAQLEGARENLKIIGDTHRYFENMPICE